MIEPLSAHHLCLQNQAPTEAMEAILAKQMFSLSDKGPFEAMHDLLFHIEMADGVIEEVLINLN